MGTVPPKFRVDLPTSVSTIQKLPHRFVQRFVSYVILDSVKLTALTEVSCTVWLVCLPVCVGERRGMRWVGRMW